MKNLLFISGLSLLMFSCSSDGLEDTSKKEEPFTYSNGNLSTGKVSSTGLVAPQGFELSEIGPAYNYGMNCLYLNFQPAARYSVSDDFIIPNNESWDISSISFFIINPDQQPGDFPVKNVALEIYDGNPELTTSKKVYGDLDINVFKSSNATNIYRLTNLTTDIDDKFQSHLIYKVETDLKNLNLKSGHYWYKMSTRFNYGEDWNCYVPRLPQQGNSEPTFNAYWRAYNSPSIAASDPGAYNGTIPVNYETPFEVTGVKTIN